MQLPYRHLTRHATLIVAALLLLVSPAYANDSIARVGTGGITFLQTHDIRLLSEELDISTKLIEVRYRFLNESAADIRTTVAFPMPRYGWNPGEDATSANVGPLTSFRVWVNNQELPTKTDRRAFIGTVDVTDSLRQFGLSEKQIFQTFGDCTIEGCGVDKEIMAKVSALADKRSSFPQWEIAETVYWQQLFPTGKVIAVRHAYTPFVGVSFSYPLQDEGLHEEYLVPKTAYISSLFKRNREACVDEATRRSLRNLIRQRQRSGAKQIAIGLKDVEYILGTGRNWKGPIGTFRLRIEKESADQLVSLCFPGESKQINPLTIEYTKKDFDPQDRLVVYFFTVPHLK